MSLAKDFGDTCNDRHRDVVTKSQLLGWVLGAAAGVIGFVFSSAMLYSEVGYLSNTVAVLEADRNNSAMKLTRLETKMEWQTETLRLIAAKLDVIAPANRQR